MREERVVDTGLEYAPGDHVVVRSVVRREGRINISDDVADGVEDALIVNVSRQGVVFLPLSRRGPLGEDEIVHRIGEASLALYEELLELA